jgi:hypothetical protein
VALVERMVDGPQAHAQYILGGPGAVGIIGGVCVCVGTWRATSGYLCVSVCLEFVMLSLCYVWPVSC